MTQRLRNRLIEVLVLLALAAAAAAVMPRAHAGMISTEETTLQSERERVKALLERPELAKQMGDYGVSADEARTRVDAMTDAEVLQLAGKLDAALAGGQLTNDQLIVILLIVIILVLLL